jgi:hypothetical protein
LALVVKGNAEASVSILTAYGIVRVEPLGLWHPTQQYWVLIDKLNPFLTETFLSFFSKIKASGLFSSLVYQTRFQDAYL